jgi:hypothetical protein
MLISCFSRFFILSLLIQSTRPAATPRHDRLDAENQSAKRGKNLQNKQINELLERVCREKKARERRETHINENVV